MLGFSPGEIADFLNQTPAPAFWALAAIGILGLGWLFGNLTGTNFLEHFCFVSIVVAFLWGLLGSHVGRTLLFPLGFLIFAVPAGQELIPLLQDFSALFAVKLLELTRVPVLLEGRFISVPYGKWEVAEACSGIRYLLSSIALGYVYAGLVYQTWVRRLGFLLASVIVPILANGLRIYGIVLLGYLAGKGAAVHIDHVLAGFVFFSIVSAFLILTGFHWREPRAQAVDSLSPQTDRVLSSSEATIPVPASATRVWRFGLFAGLALLVGSLPPLSVRFFLNTPLEQVSREVMLPTVSAPWKPTNQNLYGWTPRLPGAVAEHIQTYQNGDAVVKLCISSYAARQKGLKLVGAANSLYEPKEWMRTGERTVSVDYAGQTFRVRETEVRSARASLIIWSWYSLDGSFTSNSLTVKLLLARAWLTGSHNVPVAIDLAAEEEPTHSQAASRLTDFLGHLLLTNGPE